MKFTTDAKKEVLTSILEEYGRVVNYFIAKFWITSPIKAELLKDVLEVKDTWLSARRQTVFRSDM